MIARLLVAAAVLCCTSLGASAATETFQPALPFDILPAPALPEVHAPAAIASDLSDTIQTYSLVYVLVDFGGWPPLFILGPGTAGGGTVSAPAAVPVPSAVPVPAALPLLGAALLALGAAARRRGRALRA